MRLGFVSSMAALLAGTGLVLGQAPEYHYVQGGSLPSRSLPGTTVVVQAPAAPEGGAAAPAIPTTSSGYDCLGGCGSMPGNGVCGACGGGGGCGGCASGFCSNTVDLCAPTPYTCWTRGELLIWNIARIAVPNPEGLPVVGNLTVTPPVNAAFQVPVIATVISDGSLSDSNTRIGGEHLGARLTAGMWLDSSSHCGIEVSGFVLESRTSNISATTGVQVQSPILGAPNNQILVTDPANGDQVLILFNTGQGTINSSISNQLWGVEVNGRCGRYSIGCFSLGCLSGFRYIQFNEDLTASQDVTLTFNPGDGSAGNVDGTPASPLNINSVDHIDCKNRWYGYQVGGVFEWACGPCFVNGFAKFGLGGMRQDIEVSGATVSSGDGNTTAITGGGLFSTEASHGDFTRTRIAGIMEGSINIGYALTSCIHTYIGYDYLYMMRVVRPTNQVVAVDTTLTATVGDNTAIFNGTSPLVRFNDRDMWVQGIHFGMEFRY